MAKFKRLTPEERTAANTQRENSGARNWTETIFNDGVEIDTFKPQDGDNLIRILPPLDEDEVQFGGIVLWTYYLNGATYISPTVFDKTVDCPVMAKYKKWKGVDDDKAALFKPSKRIGAYILDFNEDTKNGKLKFWFAPDSLISAILDRCRMRSSSALIAVDDATDGRLVYFKRTGEGRMTRYGAEQIEPEPHAISEELADRVMPYRQLLRIYPTDFLQELVTQIEDKHDAKPAEEPLSTDDLPEPFGNTDGDVKEGEATAAGGADGGEGALKARIQERMDKSA